jgi:hypothetical protein
MFCPSRGLLLTRLSENLSSHCESLFFSADLIRWLISRNGSIYHRCFCGMFFSIMGLRFPFVADAKVKLKITATCVSTAQSLKELRNEYNDAPMTIVAICSETTLISASLSQIQSLVLRRHDLTNILNARPDLAAALDTSLIGCAVLFSCLHDETQRITKGSTQPSQFTWKGTARVMWNHDRLKELLDGLRGQQTAINTIINLLQV